MKTQRLRTTDLFRSASLLCLGAELEGVQRQGREVIFVLEGEKIEADDICYRTGRAVVNPLQLKETLNLLRDLIFEKGHKHGSYSRR